MAGKKNSSQTRVYPAFTKIRTQMVEFIDWLNERQPCNIPTRDVDWDTMVIRFADENGRGEIALPPSASLLKWMIENYGKSERLSKMPLGTNVSDKTLERRKELYARNANRIKEAINSINSGRRRGWFALEGYTRPDVYIETNQFILLVEGKRTESNLTDSTTFFCNGRDQLIRHMDAALELAGSRVVLGLIIYEEDAPYVPSISNEMIEESLPHRTQTDRDRIRRGWLSPMTWQELGSRFDISYPDVCRF